MSHHGHDEVLIAGAGPAGLAAALFLDLQHIPFEIIDERWEIPDDETAIVLHPDTIARLGAAGVRLADNPHARPIDRIAIYDGRRRTEVTLDGSAAILPLRVVTEALAAALDQRHHRIQWHHRLARLDVDGGALHADVEALDRVSTGYAVAGVEGEVVDTSHEEPRFLIAADGHDSVVRNQLRVEWLPVAAPELVAAFDVDSALSLDRELRAIVGSATTILWPLADGGLRVMFRLPADHAAMSARLEAGGDPDRAELHALLAEHAPDHPIRFGDVRWSFVARVEPAVAARHAIGRAWLVGDAAYRLQPWASQAVNQALREADQLAELMARAAREPGGAGLLDDHVVRSRAGEIAVARVGDLYRTTGATDPFVAAHAADILPLIPAHGAGLDHVARQLALQATSGT